MEQRPRPCEPVLAARAGFVLVGGRSSRMGRDKALLPYGGATLVEHVAARVAAAAGSVALVGEPGRYGSLPYRLIADLSPGSGPLGGIEAALRSSGSAWNLIVACDMPAVTTDFLARLLEAAETCGGDCLVPRSWSGRAEPLCAVYHRNCLPAISAGLRSGVRKMTEALEALRTMYFPVEDPARFENLNSPQDWRRHRSASPLPRPGEGS